MARQRVLVTGGAGFLGRAVLPMLEAKGYEVHAVRRCSDKDTTDKFWHGADLANSNAAEALIAKVKPDALVALAWHMAPGNASAAENFDWVQSSVALVKAFAASGGRRALVCGSCAEYDWSTQSPFSEAKTPLNPSTAYGKAKLALFKAFSDFCEISEISGVWARPFFLYGPGEALHRLAAGVTISLLQGRPALCSLGEQHRDYLHVSDVASALVELLDSDANGAVNIASGKAIAIKKLIMEIAHQIDAADLVQLGARETSPDDPDLIVADISKLQAFTDWNPQFDLHTGVADTIAWWRGKLANDRN